IMEWNYRLSFDVDTSGYTKRTYSGHLRIPQTRKSVDDHTLSDQADAYRELINPPLLVGFRRTPGTFVLSEDKCRLDFPIVDQEIGPTYPPPGVVEVSMSHEVATDRVYKGMWTATLSATYEVARNVDRATPMRYFLATALDRAQAALAVPFKGYVPDQPG